MHRGVKWYVQCHSASKWKIWGSTLDSSFFSPMLVPPWFFLAPPTLTREVLEPWFCKVTLYLLRFKPLVWFDLTVYFGLEFFQFSFALFPSSSCQTLIILFTIHLFCIRFNGSLYFRAMCLPGPVTWSFCICIGSTSVPGTYQPLGSAFFLELPGQLLLSFVLPLLACL